MNTVHVNACIVGGGPAGLMLGLLLAKRGAEVLVLEGHENFDREFRGEVLQPSTAHLLDELGLLEYMLDAAALAARRREGPVNGREVGEFAVQEDLARVSLRDLDAAAGVPRCASPQGGAVPVVPVLDGREGHEAQSRRTAHVVGVSGLRHGSEPFEVRADVVVGADGRYSAIAKLGGFTARIRAPRLRPRLVHDRAAGRLVEHASTSRSASRCRGLMLPKYPAPHPGGHRAADRRVAALATARAWPRSPIGSGGSIRSSPSFADGLKDFTPFFPLEGLVRLVRRLGARRPAAHRRRRAHHEPGGRDRRQRRAGDGRRRGAGDLSAPWARPDPARGAAARAAAPRGRRPHAAQAAAAGAARAGRAER